MNSGEDEDRAFASPPCSLHEQEADAGALADVLAWRRKERERLIGLRKVIARDERAELDAGIARGLDAVLGDAVFGDVAGRCIAVYWPIRGEPDLKSWFDELPARGAELALPVIEGRDRPLSFHAWRPGDALVRGPLNIPVPERGRVVRPDVMLSPLVGYDRERHRLGNGGGYYDRTLAGFDRKPLTIGVGYRRCAIRSIYPQPFDVPMDIVVTESSIDPPPGAADG
jgi:5,10-methenyltetrahydrofolate synthetase